MCCLLKWVTLLLGFICLITYGQTTFLSCGRRKIKTNVLVRGGVDAAAGYWPWHAAVYISRNYKCGGSILDQNTILTASHCVHTLSSLVPADSVSIHVGRVHLKDSINYTQILGVKEIIAFPAFNYGSVNHDIALIKLGTNITMNNYVQPVCLWTMNSEQYLIVGKNGTIVGFGLNVSSDQLKHGSIQVLDPYSCIESDRDVFGPLLTWDMFCGIGRAGVSACYGDAGGGMFFEIRGKWFVRGLVSFTAAGENTMQCDPLKPVVFTDVAKYLDWIKQHIDQRILPYESNVFDIEYEEKLRLFNFETCGLKSSANYEADQSTPTPPWIGVVMKSDNNDLRCTATLISQWYAVGPAECFNNAGNDTFILLGGVREQLNGTCYDRDGVTRCSYPTQKRQIKSITKHPGFNRVNRAHNIALILLLTPADTSMPNVQPICVPVTSLLRINATTNLHAAVKYGTNSIETIPVRYVESAECERQYANAKVLLKLENNQLCAEIADKLDETACLSIGPGSPLQEMKLFKGTERYFLRGFNSDGSTCKAENPVVFLAAEPYLDWIIYQMIINTANASGNLTVN